MKARNTLLLVVSVFILLIASFFTFTYFHKDATGAKGNVNMAEYVFAQVKKSCKIFLGAKDSAYTNNLGFSFSLNKGDAVCERTFPDNGTEISVWNAKDFLSKKPKNGAFSILHVGEARKNIFTFLNILSREKTTIGGLTATSSKVTGASCVKDVCPTFKVYEFKHNGHHFILEEKGNMGNGNGESIVGRLHFF